MIDAQLADSGKLGETVRGFRDVRELLDSGLCDAISVATPNHTHALIAIAAAQAALDRLFQVAPEMMKMHEIEAEEPEEEIALLSLGFCSMAFEWSFAVPSYVDYYKRADHTQGYAYFKRVLQTLQWLRGGGQWLLKAPMHMENLDEILRVPGLDVVLVGPHDLSCSLGLPEEYGHPRFEAAVREIIAKSRAASSCARTAASLP